MQNIKAQNFEASQKFQSFLAPAKINLFLHITGRRADGYHTLQSVFELLDYYDTLKLKPNKTGKIKRINSIAGVLEVEDLCTRAAVALQQATGCKMGVEYTIEKRIPMGGGLGGGSSDAASMLLALNQLWQLNLSREKLMQVGLNLGADVPVFVFGKNAWAEGVGEELTEITLNPCYYVVLTPSIHVSTAQIFANSTLTRDTKPLKIADFSRVSNSDTFRNDLEAVVCKEFPAVASAIKWLSSFESEISGKARMSGSGASVFLAVNSKQEADAIFAQKPTEVTGFVAKSLSRHPLFEFAA